MRIRFLCLAMLIGLVGVARADEAEDARLKQRLEWFQDQRFGLFMHWGIYSNLGCIESWPMCWADRSWSNPSIKTYEEMVEFRKKYRSQIESFNPTQFEPEQWAKVAKRAGMRYVVFTTKHHDGFCMYDTKLSDFRITSPRCPWSKSPRADVTKEIFNAFRNEGFGIGAYFSKPDWQNEGYWDPNLPALDRNPNYDVFKEPGRWEKFVQYTHGQVHELCANYGPLDILWLDGGQVQKANRQDIRMDELVADARKLQPNLIVVDRTAGGRHENYRTPEQEVPAKPLPYVWESCITMGTQWSFKPNDQYKSTRQLIHLLVDVVAKGGNLLLNIGPQPDGKLPPEAVKRLNEIGDWMAINGEAIHGTRAIEPYKEGRVALTRKGDVVYAIYLPADGEEGPSAKIELSKIRPRAGAEVTMLGSDEKLTWKGSGEGVVVEIPSALQASPPSKHAFVVKFQR